MHPGRPVYRMKHLCAECDRDRVDPPGLPRSRRSTYVAHASLHLSDSNAAKGRCVATQTGARRELPAPAMMKSRHQLRGNPRRKPPNSRAASSRGRVCMQIHLIHARVVARPQTDPHNSPPPAAVAICKFAEGKAVWLSAQGRSRRPYRHASRGKRRRARALACRGRSPYPNNLSGPDIPYLPNPRRASCANIQEPAGVPTHAETD